MKKVLALVTVLLVVAVTASVVFAGPMATGARKLEAISNANKAAFKTMLQSYMLPVNHGYGIALSGDSYLTAKWNIVNTKVLSVDQIKSAVSQSNATTWLGLKDDVKDAIKDHGAVVGKGRITIGKTAYVLTNLSVTNSSVTSSIRTVPNYSDCKQQNVSAESCELNSALVGNLSLTRKSAAVDDNGNEEKVWAGALNFNGTAYTFVTFVYPR
jgi:hypothetical protein